MNELVNYVYLVFMVFFVFYVINFEFVMIEIVDVLVICVVDYFDNVVYVKMLVNLINGRKCNLGIV